MKLQVTKVLIRLLELTLSVCLLFSIRRCLLRMLGNSIGESTTIHRGLKLFSLKGWCIGAGATINPFCWLDARGGIAIADKATLCHGVKIYTMTHDVKTPNNRTVTKPVEIGEYVWIFPWAIIQPGVKLGRGCVVYPGSVVTKDVAPFTIVGGNPAAILGKRDCDLDYTASYPVHLGL